jgi:hypothetical protein
VNDETVMKARNAEARALHTAAEDMTGKKTFEEIRNAEAFHGMGAYSREPINSLHPIESVSEIQKRHPVSYE